MYIGMDIGYSGLKIVFGDDKESASSLSLPVGVSKDCSSNGLTLGNEKSLKVTVDGERYVSCVSPSDLGASFCRTLDKDYSKSVNYQALFHATLLLSSVSDVDVLVTGLPVDQFLISKNRNELKESLEGTHQVTVKKSVTVKKVVVVPQPFGGYMKYINEHSDMLNRSILVFDPGFFSVDWALISKCNIDPSILGTSVNAVSTLFEKAAQIIGRDYGGNVSIDKIEHAIISGEEHVYLFGDEIELPPIIKEASEMIQGSIENELKATLRASKSDVDIVLMVGGGAMMYENAIRSVCPKSKFVVMKEAHMSNAQGFWDIAVSSK